MQPKLQASLRLVFGMIEEGINVRIPNRRFAVEKLHHGIYRAVQYYGFSPEELLDLAPEIAGAVDTRNSNTISDSAFRFLKGHREGQGCFSPQERNTQPTEGTLEWNIDRQQLYELWAPLMVSAEHIRLSWRYKPFLVVLTKWMKLYETQDLIDLCSALLDADDQGLILAKGYLWRLARDPGFGYKWDKVLPHTIAWCQSEGVWEGKPQLRMVGGRKKKTAKRPGNNRPGDTYVSG
jgi:hypothetical protein